MHLAPLLQERDRLLALGRVVIDQRDLLALKPVESAFLLGDVLQDAHASRRNRASASLAPKNESMPADSLIDKALGILPIRAERNLL
jgi:hypothetical protein